MIDWRIAGFLLAGGVAGGVGGGLLASCRPSASNS